jgi:hypothetical protein
MSDQAQDRARCGRSFPLDRLRPISRPLRIASAPWLVLLRSGQVRREAMARYCPRCRRSMNAVFVFLAFFVLVMVYLTLIQPHVPR